MWRPARRFAFWFGLVSVLALSPFRALRAGTIRHDRNDRDYVQMADNAVLSAVGPVRVAGQPSCSASLIGPQWVLCAAHCVVTPSGFIYPTQTFTVGGVTQTVTADNIFIHPQWVATGLDVGSGQGDIALFRLPTPVLNVQPLVVGRSRDEVGQVAWSVGYGRTGTGLNGQTVATTERRAGQNMIDATSTIIAWPNTAPVPIGNETMLLYDFDSPQGNYSTTGSPNPLNLEYDTAQGDSGGPLIVVRGGRPLIVGICSGGRGPIGRDVATYGDTATFSRVSSYTAWIASVMRGSERSLLTMMRTGDFTTASLARARQMATQRAAWLERLGWRETAFMAPPALVPSEQDAVFSLLVPSLEPSRLVVLPRMPEVECHGCAGSQAGGIPVTLPVGQSVLAP